MDQPVFFCDKDDADVKLHMCQTFQAQQKIEEFAKENGDLKSCHRAKVSL